MASRRLGLVVLLLGLLFVSIVKSMFAPFLLFALGTAGLVVGVIAVALGLFFIILRRS